MKPLRDSRLHELRADRDFRRQVEALQRLPFRSSRRCSQLPTSGSRGGNWSLIHMRPASYPPRRRRPDASRTSTSTADGCEQYERRHGEKTNSQASAQSSAGGNARPPPVYLATEAPQTCRYGCHVRSARAQPASTRPTSSRHSPNCVWCLAVPQPLGPLRATCADPSPHPSPALHHHHPTPDAPHPSPRTAVNAEGRAAGAARWRCTTVAAGGMVLL